MEIVVPCIVAVLSIGSGMWIEQRRAAGRIDPPTWHKIVVVQGESLNLANKRIEQLDAKYESLAAEHSKCQQEYARLSMKIEMMENR